MYDFSGIIFRIWSRDSLIVALGIIVFILDIPLKKPWINGWKKVDVKYSLIAVFLGLFLVVSDILKIRDPEVLVYKGEYVRSYSGKWLSEDYHFKNEEENMAFYLDHSSMKKIHPEELKKGNEYVIYYEKDTQIIVRIEDE